jgi:hypothetical protein
MRSWSRRAATMALGGLFAAGPLAVQGGPAGAASSQINSQQSLTFVTSGGGVATCTVFNSTTHNTDAANQPFVTTVSGLGGADGSCFDFVLLSIKITYKDKSGVRRSSTYDAFATGTAKVEGTYSPITTTVTADYFDCDPSRSATCTVTAQASPK